MFDSTIGKTWNMMTNAERAASAVNTNNLSWIGPNGLTSAPSVLSHGSPRLQINAPPNLKGDYRAGRPQFGRPLEFPSTTGELGLVIDGAGASLTDGCEPLTGQAAQAVKNKIALVDFGNCLTKVKVKNAQDAGARGVVIVDNEVFLPPPDFGTPEPSITIPAVFITLADGNLIKSVVSSRWPASSGVNVSIGLDHRLIAGLDAGGRPLLWAPFPYQGGSSLSHWDIIASPNQLMEPFLEPDLSHIVGPPRDLTLPLLMDLGW